MQGNNVEELGGVREVAVDGYDEYIFYKCMEVLKNKILIKK